jgi:hypothetical protein
MRVVPVKLARALHAETASPVRVIHEDEFTPVGVRIFKRRELAGFGAEGGGYGGSLFLVLGAWFLVSSSRLNERRAQKHPDPRTRNEEQGTKNQKYFHSAMTLLLSPNCSVSTPMRWAMRRRRLLMWASVFTGRLQSW